MTEDYRLAPLWKKVKDIKQYKFSGRTGGIAETRIFIDLLAVGVVSSELVSGLFPDNGKNTGKSPRFSQPKPRQPPYLVGNRPFSFLMTVSGVNTNRELSGKVATYDPDSFVAPCVLSIWHASLSFD